MVPSFSHESHIVASKAREADSHSNSIIGRLMYNNKKKGADYDLTHLSERKFSSFYHNFLLQ
jgi:hypothetical protein